MVSLAGVREVVLPGVDDVSNLDDPHGASESRTRPPPPVTTPLSPLTVLDGKVYFLAYNRVKNIYLNNLKLSVSFINSKYFLIIYVA
jgi:hypothetical protein